MRLDLSIIKLAAFAAVVVVFGVQAAIAGDQCYDLGKKGHHHQAINACTGEINSGLHTGHNLAILYVNRGADYGATGQFTLAIADFSKAIDVDPSNTNAYEGRGAAYALNSQYALAMDDFKKALQMDQYLADDYIGVGGFAQLNGSGDITAPGKNRHDYSLVTFDASVCHEGGQLIINGRAGKGQSAASFDIFLANQPVTISGRPVSCGHAYDVHPGSPYILSCIFPAGQKLTFGAEGSWFSPAGSTNTHTYYAIINCK
ncbi:MAG: tetratricopeptide repeat protein [Actinomycetota bacterium]|nr:tetratricopeptide repeat protein [Actinomycetota bacterium]